MSPGDSEVTPEGLHVVGIAFLGICDTGLCPRDRRHSTDPLACRRHGGHRSWFSSPSGTHRRHGARSSCTWAGPHSPGFRHFQADALRTQHAALRSPFPCLSARCGFTLAQRGHESKAVWGHRPTGGFAETGYSTGISCYRNLTELILTGTDRAGHNPLSSPTPVPSRPCSTSVTSRPPCEAEER